MIEVWWRSLKHGWLLLNKLDTMAAVERRVAFYLEQHNSVLPHSALGGLAPDEVYFGRGEGVVEQLAAEWSAARAARLAASRGASCGRCQAGAEVVSDPKTPVILGASQMRTPESRMSS